MMKGVQYVVDEGGEPTAVVIDLKANSELRENFHDQVLAIPVTGPGSGWGFTDRTHANQRHVCATRDVPI